MSAVTEPAAPTQRHIMTRRVSSRVDTTASALKVLVSGSSRERQVCDDDDDDYDHHERR